MSISEAASGLRSYRLDPKGRDERNIYTRPQAIRDTTTIWQERKAATTPLEVRMPELHSAGFKQGDMEKYT